MDHSDPTSRDELATLVASLDAELVAHGVVAAPSVSERATSTTHGEPFVLFEMAGTQFLAPLEQVIEVGQPEAVTHVPRTPAWVLGVTNLRGDIVSLVDLGAFLALDGPRAERGRTLVVRDRAADQTLALRVDSIVGMRRVPRATIGKPRSELAGSLAAHLIGVTEYAERLAVVIDLASVIRSPEIQQFRAQ